MPFVPDSHFQKKEKAEEMREQIMKAKERAFINDKAKEEQPKKPLNVDNSKIIKQIMKHTHLDPKEKQKPITLKEIKDNLKIGKFIEEEKEKEIEEILDNAEIQEVKGEFVNVLALAHTNPIKRHIFANKLQQSKTISNYVNDNVILRMFNKANQNLKFAVVYGIKYLETNKDYESLLLIQKLKEEENKKLQAEEQKKQEETKEEQEKQEETKEETRTE